MADERNLPAWNRRVTLELLRKEAEQMLGVRKQDSAEE